MNPDENAVDPTRKEIQEFDPALLGEEGIHPEFAQDAESIVLEQEQRDDEVEEQSRHGVRWHTFLTP